MDERQFIVELAFKPLVSCLRLTLEQSQLILAYMHGILQEAAIEEQAIMAEKALTAVETKVDGDGHNVDRDGGDGSSKTSLR
jgi:hypothetical protein